MGVPDALTSFPGFAEELAELRGKNLYRAVRELEPLDPVRARLSGREVLLFCANDYLGLSRHPRVMEAMRRALDAYGAGAGAARLISGTSREHAQLEEEIARFKHKPRALLYTAGYMANVGVLTALAREGDLIVMDKLCHASLVDGARLSGAEMRVFPHRNYERCAELLERSSGRRKILVTDTIFSMDGDAADLSELIRLKERFGALLVADDAHGTGVLGSTGRGATEGFEEGVDVIVGTLSKAAGVLGGFAAVSEELAAYLINFSRPFIFATAPPAAVCAAASEALRVIQEEPEHRTRLWEHFRFFSGALLKRGWLETPPAAPIFPLGVGPEDRALRLSEALLEKGFLVPAVRTPTVPKGKARLRVTLSAAHERKDLERLLGALEELGGLEGAGGNARPAVG